MLVVVMCTSFTGARADKVTLVEGSGSSGYTIPEGWTTTGTVEGGSYLKFDNGTITSPEFAPHTGLSFAYTVATFGGGTNHPLTIRILNASTDDVIVEKTTATPTSSSYINTNSPLSLGDVNVPFKVQLYGPTGKGVRLRNYSITGTPAGGSSAVATTTTINASGITNTDLYKGANAGSLSATVVDNEENEVDGATITWSGDNNEVATIDANGAVTLVAAGTVTFTATYAGVSGEYNASSDTYEMTVTDSTPVPTYTATFSVNGATTTTEYKEGADIEFPANPADVSGKTFIGWSATAIDGTTDDAPEFVTSATMGKSDVTYYAVFAYANDGGSEEVVDVLNRDFTGNTGTSYANWSDKTSNSDAVYAGNSAGGNSSIQLRSTSPSGIVSTASGGKAKKVSLKWNSNTASGRTVGVYGSTEAYESAADLYNQTQTSKQIGTIVNGTSTELEITGNYDYIGIRSEGNALYLDEVKITWEAGEGITYSEYCTTVVAAAVERPVIEVAANPFIFSTTATITCATDDATIYYRYDENDEWTEYTEALNLTTTTTIYAKAVKDNDESSVATITVTKNLVEPAVAIDATGITNTNVDDSTEAGTLSASVTYNEEVIQGAIVAWSSSDEDVATIDENGAVTLVAKGTVTFTATFAGNGDFSEKSATYEMTVENPNAPGSVNNPYTVAEAVAYIGTLGSATSATEIYVSGIISQVDSYNSKYSSITYWISDNGTTEGQMEVYSGKGIDGADFASVDDLQVGDIVTVKGFVKMYNTTPEFTQNNQLVSFVRPVVTTPSINLGENEINAFAQGTDGVILVNYENITDVVAEVFFCDADGNAATYDWLTASINSINNLEYIIDANTSADARTAYMKVHALDDDANDVYSELITINQEGYVAPATPGKWVETTLASLTSSDVFVIVGDNGENYALSNDKGASSAPTAVKVDVEGNTLKSEPENNVKWTIDFTENGFVFYPYGSTETWLYCTNDNNGVRVGTNKDNKEFTTTEEGYLKNIATSRFVGVYKTQDWRCYTSNTGNIANQTFKFYKRIDADKVQTISVTDAGYATLVAKEDLEVPAGIEVFAVQVKGIYAHLEPVTAGVPAGEAVIVKAVAEGDYSLPYAEDAVNAINGNELKASDEPIEADGTQYILAKPENEEVGFYPAATGTTIAAGKAYLQITGTAPVKGFTFSFDDDATGINEELRMKNEDSDLIFNLAGQRIQKMQKGINIINGKKVLF